ncbi:hypothetical protein B0H14DRAFT_3132512 [Mycena olivaceomarginata]|nr:hypothetical protein B0H14DRAFT_3132512 [Mycena olivaceomarginata]
MTFEYEIWYRDPDVVIRNMLGNPDFDGEFDTTPYVELDRHGQRRWSDFMSGNFAWKQCDKIITDDPTCAGGDRSGSMITTPHFALSNGNYTTLLSRHSVDIEAWYDNPSRPFIADYPEQVLLAGTVQNWCPKCTALPSNSDGPSDYSDYLYELTMRA